MREILEFEFEVSGVMEDGMVREFKGGKASGPLAKKYDDYVDDGILYALACESAVSHFYIFEIEKKGGGNLSEVAVKIKNLVLKNPSE